MVKLINLFTEMVINMEIISSTRQSAPPSVKHRSITSVVPTEKYIDLAIWLSVNFDKTQTFIENILMLVRLSYFETTIEIVNLSICQIGTKWMNRVNCWNQYVFWQSGFERIKATSLRPQKVRLGLGWIGKGVN